MLHLLTLTLAFDDQRDRPRSRMSAKLREKQRESPFDDSTPEVRWQLDETSSDRIYTWSPAYETTMAVWKSAHKVNAWTVCDHIARPSPAPGVRSALGWPMQLVRLLVDWLSRFFRSTNTLEGIDTETDGSSIHVREMHRIQCSDVDFVFLSLPRIAISGLRRDETHYAMDLSDRSRKVLDRLMRKRFPKKFFNQTTMPPLPLGLEINEEVVIIPLRPNAIDNGIASVDGGMFHDIFMYNTDPHEIPKSTQFEEVFAFFRKDFRRIASPFPRDLVWGCADNFLALPGTSKSINADLLTTAIDLVRAHFGEARFVEVDTGRPLDANISKMWTDFKRSKIGRLAAFFGLGKKTGSGSECEIDDHRRLARPNLEDVIDDMRADAYVDGLREVLSRIWVPIEVREDDL